MNEYPIDFVVTWLDSSDPNWIAEYDKYRPIKHNEDKARFSNWDLFRFWFRSVEQYAQWVNKVYLVTCGHYPKWLNSYHPKLILVKHSDYIPQKYLPTFNSRCIELNFGRIEGLSEHFVYFNDDMFLNAPVMPETYFKKGLPVDFNYERVFLGIKYNPQDLFGIELSLLCNIAVINYHFNRRKVIQQAPWKWYGKHHTKPSFKQSLLLLRKERFEGFTYRHTEQPFLKSVFKEIWEKEPFMLDKSCTKFRVAESLTPYFVRYWQFATNRFYPENPKGRYQGFSIRGNTLERIIEVLKDTSTTSLCINDSPCCDTDFYETASMKIKSAFESKFPQKSSFEI